MSRRNPSWLSTALRSRAAIVVVFGLVTGFSAAGQLVSDDFNSPTLNTSLWTTILNGGSYSLNGTELELTAPAGANHDPSQGGVNNSVRVVQTVGNADFLVEVKFDSIPLTTSGYVGQGILVQQDASDYLRLEFGSNGGVTAISADQIISGSQTSLHSSVISTSGANSLWMRIQKAGSTWTQSWSTNGTTYTTALTFTQTLTVSGVGLYANNYNSPATAAPAYTAVVDYFHNDSVPDLTITKSHTGSFAQGGTGSYTLTANNVGDVPTSGTVTVTDTVPTGLTPTAATGTGWTCTISTPTVTCTRSDVLAAAASYPAITLSVSVASNAPSSVTNMATVAGGGETNTSNDTATDPTTITAPATPDLTITKSHTGSFVQGSTGSYTLTASNIGTGATSAAVTVTDTVPTGLTPTAATGTGWTCTISTPTVTCTRSDVLAAAASYPAITLSVSVASNAPSSVTNMATVAGGGETNTSNDTATDPTTIATSASGPVSDDFNSPTLNTSLWTTILNGGSYSLNGTELELTAPAGANHDPSQGGVNNSVRVVQTVGNADFLVEVKFDSIPLTTSGYVGQGILVQQDASDYLRLEFGSNGGVTAISADQIISGSQTSLHSSVISTSGANSLWMRIQKAGSTWTQSWSTNGTTYTTALTFTQTLTVSGVGLYANNYNSPATAAPAYTAVVDYFHNDSVPDLTITKSHTGSFAQGGTGSYTLTANNVGDVPTSGTVTVTDTVPTGLTPTAATGTGWTCTISTPTVTCTRSDVLAAAASYPAITLSVSVASNAPSSVTNMATVAGGGETNTSNDTATDPTTITAPATPDLTITKSHTGSFVQGSTGSYTLTASNIGTGATSAAVTVTDTVPTGLTPTAATGTGWTCTISTPTVTCTRSDVLAAAASYPAITLSVSVASNAPSSVTNMATVAGGGETNTSNDTATDPTTITAPATPDLTITKSHTGSFVQGSTGSYTLTASNIGTGATSAAVTVTDTVPTGLTPTAATGTGWTCTISTPTVTCTRSDVLAAAASYPAITLSVSVASNAPSSVTNMATVAGGGETNTSNDTATDPTTIATSASGPVSDDFNSPTLNTSLWTTILNGGSYSLSGTELELTAPAGANHDPSLGGVNDSVRVVQTVGNADFLVEVKFDSIPLTTSGYVGQGILVQQDASDYLRLEFGSDGGVTAISADQIISGSQTSLYSSAISTSGATSLWMRIQKAGSTWTQSWSTNGTTYTTALTFTQSLTVSAVGLYANNYNSPATAAPAYTAVVDYFHNASGPDLTITKSHSGDFVLSGTGSYTMAVSNVGDAATSGTVTVTDSVPTGLTPTAATGTGWTCTISTPTVTCTRSDVLAAAASYPAITLSVSVASNAPSSVTNMATVAGGNETNTGNDSAADPTTIGTMAGNPVSDDFSSFALSSEWTFVNPQNDGSYSLNGSGILLSVPGGIAHDVWTSADNSVRIMQPIADADFQVEVKFNSAVDINTPYQEQGIVVQQDASDFLHFSIQSVNLQIFAFAASISGSTVDTFVNQEMRGGPATYIRLSRTGNNWSFSYSYDSYHWTPAFTFNHPFHVASIGPYVGNAQYNGQSSPAFTAVVDHFINFASPPSVVDGSAYPPPVAPPSLTVLYGNNQTFGQPGVPQQWVNILGNVSSFNEIATLTYSLNGAAPQPLSMGEDTYRLVDAGDFNAEIDYASLLPGNNTVEIRAIDYQGLTSNTVVNLTYVSGQSWPLPYSVSTWPTNLQSASQIVDGQWQAQTNGTSLNTQQGYDRLVDVGDRVTWQNYVVTAQITMNWLDPWAAAVGIIVGWQGHSSLQYGQALSIQPRIGHPFPAFFEYSSATGPPNLYIWTNTADVPETPLATEVRTLQVGTTYMFKCQVQENTSGGSQFSFKVWPAGTSEPSTWDLQANGELSTGSILLAAYRANVTFGRVTITGL